MVDRPVDEDAAAMLDALPDLSYWRAALTHLLLDGFGAPPDALQDFARIYALLDRLPAELGMTKLTPPLVFRCRSEGYPDWGISAVVLLLESHITIHTAPEEQSVHLDVYCCKPFASEPVVARVRETFGLTAVDLHVVERMVPRGVPARNR